MRYLQSESLVFWLEKLLEKRLVVPPEVIHVEKWFERMSVGLDKMRRGEISGGKLVVEIR